MKNMLIRQFLGLILPFIKDNILKFEKQLHAQMQAIPLNEGEQNVAFMVYADADGSLKGSLGVIEQHITPQGVTIMKLGRPIKIEGKEEINFTELLLQFSQIDNELIISEAQRLPETLTEK